MSVNCLFVGLATLDVIQLVEHPPGANEKTVALDSVLAAGGPATNAAVAAAHLGAGTALVTALPSGPVADIIRADLAARGVTIHAVPTDADAVVASILVSRGSGDRAVVSPTSSASSGSLPALTPNDIEALIDGVGAVQLDGYYPDLALPLAAAARQRGIPVVADLGSFKPHTPEVLAHVDVAVVSADFAPPGANSDPSSVLEYVTENGPTLAAVTRGSRGIVFRGPRSRGTVPVRPVHVEDTLGAGDFFHGALTQRIADRGWDAARFEADLAFAAGVAGRSVGSFGTRAWLGER
ncbi:PfkB family carbohydrate kinase [Demequina sp. TTPB684]|uniref:PfkB family carbohydrate kinase n=1 Tax=unclassified Demequina TaxID=2620311 RepID=UPI001CF21CFE|nr:MULTISPECIES: PfkB family carbohydrate kinase [unclassified Demequina]MCB2412017.1 PfkB family carbohydrate kinase [Demequina sp. TTPB684]UPU88816.1 PfkB family carbohydrate kinase [Demequina sp. TMPB413]